MTATLKAIIWDCDGVIAETEADGHRVAFNRVFAEEGLGVQWDVPTYAERLKIAGGKERMRSIVYAPDFNKDVPDKDAYIRELHRRKTDHFMELIENGQIQARPGVRRLMREAHAQGIRLAVASTSNERSVTLLARRVLGEEVNGWLEVILAGDVVQRKKPAPDIYVLAAQKLNLKPSQCLVVEDSENGVLAALAAGMRVLVTRSEYTKHERFPQALLQVDELGESREQGITIERLQVIFEAHP